jgi:hypothetical protein
VSGDLRELPLSKPNAVCFMFSLCSRPLCLMESKPERLNFCTTWQQASDLGPVVFVHLVGVSTSLYSHLFMPQKDGKRERLILVSYWHSSHSRIKQLRIQYPTGLTRKAAFGAHTVLTGAHLS